MRIKVITIGIIATIIITLVIVLVRNTGETKERLFSEEEIAYKNIESIAVDEYKTNQHILTNSDKFIKQISSTLSNLQSDNITTSQSLEEKPLYVIYISTFEFSPGGGIGIYKQHVEYKGKNQTISDEEFSTLIKLLESEIKEKND